MMEDNVTTPSKRLKPTTVQRHTPSQLLPVFLSPPTKAPTRGGSGRRWQQKQLVFVVSHVLKWLGLLWLFCTLWVMLEFKRFVHEWSEEFTTMSKKPPISASIPLPLPNQRISVVLMNYSRPRMIRESQLMPTLLAHPSVDEVLLLHANPSTAFEYVHPKVVNLDATQHNEEMGLSLRFFFCQLAKNDWVLHVDDDMEFAASALDNLLIEFGHNPKRLVGKFGREMSLHSSFHGYSSRNTHEGSEVVLTKIMMMERATCPAFFRYAHLIWDDVVLYKGEGPLWNGEDIFMSLVANHVYGNRKNYAMDWLDVWEAPDHLKDYDHGKLDISGGMKGIWFWDWQWWQSVLRRNRHYAFRGMLWRTAKKRLAELPRDEDPLPQLVEKQA